MATSWRINTLERDVTSRTSTSSANFGAMAFYAPKGPKTFTFFERGSTKAILNTFGYPTADYPAIQDAIDINNKTGVWLASPYKNGKFGGVFVTKKGTVPFGDGFEAKEVDDLENVPCVQTVGIGNGVLTTFTTTLTNFKNYVNESIGIKVGATDLELSFDTVDGVEKITDNNNVLASEGSEYNRSNGELTLVFATAIDEAIVCSYKMDVSDTYFILYDKNPQSDDLKVKVIADENVEGAFNVYVARYNPVAEEYEEIESSPYLVGLSENSKDTYKRNIFIENIFGDEQFMFTPEVITSVVDDFEDDTEFVTLAGGSRGGACSGSDLSDIYDELQDTNKFNIKLVVDPESEDDVVAKFEILRKNYQKRCRFIYCSPVGESATSIISTPATSHRGVTADSGLYCYCLNWGIHRDSYLSNNFLCSNMGLIGGRIIDVLNVGGGVPAMIDGDDGVGGILGSSIVKLIHNSTESQLEKLDALGFNPVVNDPTYGAMIVGWKTRQVKPTVYSSIGQASLRDTLIELIEKNVLPQQLGKLIDDVAFTRVTNGCNIILDQYSRYLTDYIVICDDRNNTPETKDNQKLMLTVGVQFVGYAEQIIFTFTAVNNSVNLEESVA